MMKFKNILPFIVMALTITSCLSDPFADDEKEESNKDPLEHDKSSYVPLLDSTKVIYIDWADTISVKKYITDDSVSVSIKGNDVIINSIINDTIEYVISGKTDDGMFKVYSAHDFNLVFNQIEIKNQRGPAINIQSKKRAYMYMFGRSKNIFEDAYSYQAPEDPIEDQKGCMFAEGKIIIGGDSLATLTIKSNSSHSICSDAYVSIIDGNIFLDAFTDGIHANDEVAIEDGNLEIKAKSDGVECEAGRIIINGGTIKIECDDKGLATSYRGTSSKIKPDIIVNGGDIDIKVNLINGKGIRSIGDYTMTAGKVKILADKEENEGIESKKAMNIYDGEIVVEVFDNGLNSGTDMTFYGGKIYSLSTGNDGIDSNGKITINGGKIIAIGAGESECGFDCGTNTFKVTGGIFVGIGTSTTKPNQNVSTQPSLLLTQQFNKGDIFSIRDESNYDIITFIIPDEIGYSNNTLISSPQLLLNKQINIYTGGNILNGEYFYGLNENGIYSNGKLFTTTTINKMLIEM